ncbi:MAG: Hsp20/alpha crystallin family protein [Candidatus Thorarchaeota archaeon]
MSDAKENETVNTKNEELSEQKTNIEETPKEKVKKGAIQLRRHRPLSIFKQFDHLFDDLDRYFRDFWRPSRLWDFEPFNLKIFDEDEFFRTPLTNIVDNGDNYSISAEIPGLDKGDIEISVHDGILEIKGEQKNEHEEKKDGYVRREFHSSSYHRTFTIPENIDEDNIDAKLDKGVLTLKLPKNKEERKEKKKIEVK